MSDSYFSLLGVDKTFDVNLEQLSANYLRLQQSLHPDRHVNGSPSEKLLAASKLIEVSQAHRVLKSPFERGEYLLTLQGYKKPDESQTIKDPSLLMEQMELREQLSELRSIEEPFEALEKFQKEVSNLLLKQVESLSSLFAAESINENVSKTEMQVIEKQLVRLRFLDKLQQEIERFEEQLDDF